MDDPTSPAWTLAGISTDTVWAGRNGVSLPAIVEIDTDGDVTAHPHPQPRAGTVRLVPPLSELTDEVVLDLLEVLIAIPGVRPAEIPMAVHHEVSVPLLTPSSVTTADQVTWIITDQLAVVHADRRDIYFVVAGETRANQARPHVELTPPQVWLLIRALATIRCWQFVLEADFSAAATHRRAALLLNGSATAAGLHTASSA